MPEKNLNVKILCGADAAPDRLHVRNFVVNAAAEKVASEIIAAVRERGDAAVAEYTKKYDGVEIDTFAVPQSETDEAAQAVNKENPGFAEAFARASENIGAYHKRQIRQGFAVTGERDGVVLGQRVIPLERVGIYIPGGTAAYPSTLLMNVIPAKLAGVSEIYVATPPQKNGKCAPAILAAAKYSGIDKIYKAGGAQAIAAFAYGTESFPRVDKITGPGNVYVAAAKRQLYGIVDIDMIAGPSEILIIADGGADARYIAADMLSQAEHDEMAAALLITVDDALAAAVVGELSEQLASLPRGDIAARSLEANCRIAVVGTLEQAAALSNGVAPEHLELCVRDPFGLLGLIRNAGSVFLGDYTPETLGDYLAGPNHTLPTNGAARFSSPLSVDDFVKKSSFTYYAKDALRRDAKHAACFARQEGFEAHARSVEIRAK